MLSPCRSMDFNNDESQTTTYVMDLKSTNHGLLGVFGTSSLISNDNVRNDYLIDQEGDFILMRQ